ncbi:uncharacterized protein BDR25DRAFT_353797 [Lindgomyces ingoldianus]|uniref:Uncharacterized protein n=1 Tax=Lindgomyces ingoldianus TaxID=673940 RepID=A0ACB6R0S5_9PLEO|nr:uncharacterized protein BDR25DRAFT_353797 [Lindgomyces ingoldianus]KAF2472056.1 hypothetical protein BDR25DRAFT_353797 [Lindgomyces ingoldianus]
MDKAKAVISDFTSKSGHHDTTIYEAFKSKGGALGGREERYDGFEGEPKNIGGALLGLKSTSKRDSHQTEARGVPSNTRHGDLDLLDGKHSHHTANANTGGGFGMGGRDVGGYTNPALQQNILTNNDSPAGSNLGQPGTAMSKPPMVSRLNPLKDGDGDRKKVLWIDRNMNATDGKYIHRFASSLQIHTTSHAHFVIPFNRKRNLSLESQSLTPENSHLRVFALVISRSTTPPQGLP